jgi:hypothetical protein
MKKFSLLFLTMSLLFAAIVLPAAAFGQKSKKDSIQVATITALVESKHYIFKARSVTPMGGRMRQLTSDYGLKVSHDTIISDLPYFGRAYSTTMNSSDAGIQFTSKDFEYVVTPKKKGNGWDINIKFKDTKDVKQMQLSIFDNGSSSLQVISNSRQSISFDGDIIEPRKK